MSHIISLDEIDKPIFKIALPTFVLIFIVLVFMLILIAVIFLPFDDEYLRFGVLGVYGLVTFGIYRNYLKRGFLILLCANKKGLYFQTDEPKNYFYIPWDNIGIMEKTIYPVNQRGLRIEIRGEYIEHLKKERLVGEIRKDSNRTFVYTIPQLNDRDKLISTFEKIKSGY